MNPQELQNDIFLRVAAGSGLDKVLRAAEDTGKLSHDDIAELGGKKYTAKTLVKVKPWFDNLDITNRDGYLAMNLVDVVGRSQTVVNVKSAEFAGGDGTSPQTGEHESIIWPTAPHLLDLKDYIWFRKPSWYNGMKAMVEEGSHISLSGPPSGGKDTAVEYLAAETKTPLVSIGGGSGIRRKDMTGFSEMVNGTSRFDVAEAAAAIINGWWLLITEANSIEPDALMLLNGVLAAPYHITFHGKQYPVHPNFRLFISYNPGLIGTKPLPQSFKDRLFPIQVPFPTNGELKSRLEAHGMPVLEEMETVLVDGREIPKDNWPEKIVEFGEAMWKAHTDGNMRYQITVRRLIDAVKLVNMGAVSNVKKALRMAAITTIDSPVENKAAEKVLNNVFQ